MKLPTALKGWVCAARGHRWTKSRTRAGYLKCTRCGARMPAAQAQPSAEGRDARTEGLGVRGDQPQVGGQHRRGAKPEDPDANQRQRADEWPADAERDGRHRQQQAHYRT